MKFKLILKGNLNFLIFSNKLRKKLKKHIKKFKYRKNYKNK